MQVRDPFPDEPEIVLSKDTLAFLVLKARAYDAETAPTDPDDSSNAADDRGVGALESGRDNPNRRELTVAINALNEEEQTALVALVWLGRGDFDADEWEEALAAARARREGPVWRYLAGMPLLGDMIEEGAAKLDINLTDEEQSGLHHQGVEQPSEEDRD